MKKYIIPLTLIAFFFTGFAMDTVTPTEKNLMNELPLELQREILLKIEGNNLKAAWKNISALLATSKYKSALNDLNFKRKLLKSLIERYTELYDIVLNSPKEENQTIVMIAQQLGLPFERSNDPNAATGLKIALDLGINPNDSDRGKFSMALAMPLYQIFKNKYSEQIRPEKNFVEKLKEEQPYLLNAIKLLVEYGATLDGEPWRLDELGIIHNYKKY